MCCFLVLDFDAGFGYWLLVIDLVSFLVTFLFLLVLPIFSRPGGTKKPRLAGGSISAAEGVKMSIG